MEAGIMSNVSAVVPEHESRAHRFFSATARGVVGMALTMFAVVLIFAFMALGVWAAALVDGWLSGTVLWSWLEFLIVIAVFLSVSAVGLFVANKFEIDHLNN